MKDADSINKLCGLRLVFSSGLRTELRVGYGVGEREIIKLDLATGVREQKKEEATMLAGALLDAEARIGDLLSETEHRGGSATAGTSHPLPKGINKKQSHIFQTLADHPEVIEQVKAEAKENDDLPTRTEVLRKIKENSENSEKKALSKPFTFQNKIGENV